MLYVQSVGLGKSLAFCYALIVHPAAAAADESTSDDKRAQVQARSSSSSAARFRCHSAKTPYYQKGLLIFQ